MAYARTFGEYQPPPPPTVAAEAEGLRLHLSSSSSTGYKGVFNRSGRFTARHWAGGQCACACTSPATAAPATRACKSTLAASRRGRMWTARMSASAPLQQRETAPRRRGTWRRRSRRHLRATSPPRGRVGTTSIGDRLGAIDTRGAGRSCGAMAVNSHRPERKKEKRQPKGGMGGRHAATTQGFWRGVWC